MFPDVETFPNNGNEGRTFDVRIGGLAEHGTTIEIDSLRLDAGATLRSTGAWDINVLGDVRVEGTAFLTRGMFLDEGLLLVNGDVDALRGLNLTGWRVEARNFYVGGTDNGSPVNGGVTSLDGGIKADRVEFRANGNISADNGGINTDALVKLGGAGLSTVTAQFVMGDGALLECHAGELRFPTPPANTGITEPAFFEALSVATTNGGVLGFYNGALLGGAVNYTANTGRIDFFSGDFTLQTGALTTAGTGLVRLNGGSATITRGTINASETCPFEHSAGTLGTTGVVTIAGTYRWVAGTIGGRGAGSLCVEITSPEGRAETEPGAGSRLVEQGILLNSSHFTQDNTVSIGVNGKIENQRTWVCEGNVLVGAGAAGLHLFENKPGGEVLKDSFANATVVADFRNMSIVRARNGRITFNQALDLVAGELTDGRWIAEATGEISFGGNAILKIGPGSDVTINGPDARFDGLSSLSDLSGRLELANGSDASSDSAVNITDDGFLDLSGLSSYSSAGDVTTATGGTCSFSGSSSMTCGTLNNGSKVVVGSGGTGETNTGAGTIVTLNADFINTPSGTLEIHLEDPARSAPERTSSRIDASGTVSLAGTISVVEPIGFTPLDGEEFVILTASSVSGAFDTIDAPCNYTVSYSPTSVQLTYSAAVCEPCNAADLNPDGVLNVDDIDAFVGAFLGGDPAADCDMSGSLNVDDIDCFVAAFLAGC